MSSDAVIEGTVLSVERGRTLSLDAGTLQLFEVRVRVDALEAGTLPEQEIVLEVDSVVFPGLAGPDKVWPAVGTSTILFLHRKLDSPMRFRPISSQGAFTVRGDDLIAANPLTSLAAGIESMAKTDLLMSVRATTN